jgi:pimeloyl-ACP methyl ester carboxylesterase
MKNIKFIFGIVALCWLPICLTAQVGITSDRSVTFLHGLGEDAQDWQPFVDFFNGPDNRRMSTSNPSFANSGGLTNITASARVRTTFGSTSLAICHSLGGLVARRLDRDAGMRAGA